MRDLLTTAEGSQGRSGQFWAQRKPVPSALQALVLGVAGWTLGTAAALAAYSTIVLHAQEGPTAQAAAADGALLRQEKSP